MASKVKLKFKDRSKPVAKETVLQTAAITVKAPFTRLFETGDGYKAICRSTEDAEKILSSYGVAEFNKIGITVMTPPELKAQRSIFVRQLDSTFGSHSPTEIKEELEYMNEWMKIEEVVKIGTYTHVMKVRFAETSMADKALSSGFGGFNWHVTPDQIQREEYTNLLLCFSCYRYEDHATNNCPTKDQKVCSNCATVGHSFRECPNTDAKGCLNCVREGREGMYSHRTMAMACPIKKQKIKEKKEAEKKKEEAKQQTTYVDIAKKAVEQAQSAPLQMTTIELSKKTDYQVLVCILYSHVMNLANPGTFNKEMNELLQINNLPQMTFPANPDSGKALRISSIPMEDIDVTPRLSSTQEERDVAKMPAQAAAKIVFDDDQSEDDDSDSNSTAQSEEIDVESSERSRPPRKLPASKIGLKLFYGKRHPRKFDENLLVAQEINAGLVKFTFTDENHSNQEIIQLIERNQIDLHRDLFTRLDSKLYTQLQSGLVSPKTSTPLATAAQLPALRRSVAVPPLHTKHHSTPAGKSNMLFWVSLLTYNI